MQKTWSVRNDGKLFGIQNAKYTQKDVRKLVTQFMIETIETTLISFVKLLVKILFWK